jgi:hypothetical protein
MISIIPLLILIVAIFLTSHILRKKEDIEKKRIILLCTANVVIVVLYCIFGPVLLNDSNLFLLSIVLVNVFILWNLSILNRLIVGFSISIIVFFFGTILGWGLRGFPPG